MAAIVFVGPADRGHGPLLRGSPERGSLRKHLRVPFDLGRLLRAPLPQGRGERRIGDPVAAAHRRRQEAARDLVRSEEHTSELQSLMRISYAVFCLKKKKQHSTLSNKIRYSTESTRTCI